MHFYGYSVLVIFFGKNTKVKLSSKYFFSKDLIFSHIEDNTIKVTGLSWQCIKSDIWADSSHQWLLTLKPTYCCIKHHQVFFDDSQSCIELSKSEKKEKSYFDRIFLVTNLPYENSKLFLRFSLNASRLQCLSTTFTVSYSLVYSLKLE